MKIRASAFAVFAGALLLAVAPRLGAQITTYTWTGANQNWDPYDDYNWSGLVAPDDSSAALTNAHLVFGNISSTYLEYYNLYAQQLEISGNKLPYYFSGDYDSAHLGAGGILYAPATNLPTVLDDYIVLEADQAWNIASGTLAIDGDFESSTFALTKTGSGTLDLRASGYDYGWTGGLTLSEGRVIARAYQNYYSSGVSYSLGSGTITFNGGTLVTAPNADPYYYSYDQMMILQNNIVSNGLISVAARVDTLFAKPGDGTSSLTLNADTTIQVRGKSLEIDSDIVEAGGSRKLTINSSANVILTGENTYTGGTTVTNGALILGSAYSNPAYANDDNSKLTAGANGYIGFGDEEYTSGTQTVFVNSFDKANTHGSIGFDTDPALSTPNTFNDGVDLTGFASDARLGSATRAILSSIATITPQGINYRFGGGGGWLEVDSALTGAGALVLDSPIARPLTLRLTSTANSWSGGTTVMNSGVIFGSGGYGSTAFSGADRSVAIGTGGYAGFEDPGYDGVTQSDLVAGMLGKVSLTSTGMVGFDVEPGSSQFFSSGTVINLGSFTGNLYLGTASRYTDDGEQAGLSISGPITTTNGGADPYRFAGYKGGWLQVNTALSGSAGVKIGDPTSPGTFGDPLTETYSTVQLSGSNSALTGDVTVYGGQLIVSQNNGITGTDPTNALGTGKLIVQGMTLPTDWQDADGVARSPMLAVDDDGIIINNNIQLNTRLNAGGNSFTLGGTISGTGSLYLQDEITLTLSGNNTFSGGIYLSSDSALHLNHVNASGTGPLSFGGSSSAQVYFNTAAPVIGGLVSNDYADYAYLHATVDNTVLTINQAVDSSFNGQIAAESSNHTLRVVKAGSGTLVLDDFYYYNSAGTTEATLGGASVSLQVNQGTVVLGSDAYISNQSPTVWVHGGTLALASGYLDNPVVVDNGGKLAGSGYFTPTAGVVIGAGATLSPGFSGTAEIGTLGFNHLELNGGGTYIWQIKSTNASDANGQDHVYVYEDGGDTLVINATSADRFTLKVISLTLAGNTGLLNGFDPNQGYSWSVMGFDILQGTFDPSKFTIDATGFANSLTGTAGGDGAFSLSLVGNEIRLNFSPVPEPSTYALLALGLGASGLVVWRKRRRA